MNQFNRRDSNGSQLFQIGEIGHLNLRCRGP
jgi:hypothetical protein